jgi:hypothetical protein
MMIEWEDKVRTPASWSSRMAIAALIFLNIIAWLPTSVWPHGGGTDANGCHNDRKNGGRHCHGGSSTPPAGTSGSPVYYPNCAAVRAAGAAPLYRGQPGYGLHLDGDGDGKACE